MVRREQPLHGQRRRLQRPMDLDSGPLWWRRVDNSELEIGPGLRSAVKLRKHNQHNSQNQQARAAFLSAFGMENAFLAKQAYELINRLPADSTSPTECVAVGTALGNAQLWDQSAALLHRAREQAHDANDAVAAYRDLA